MNTQAQIAQYLADQPEAKREELQTVHQLILHTSPGCDLWFLDGRNEAGKIVSNPNIGYGTQTIRCADGKTRDFYQIGLSANTSGISLYVIGIEDKNLLRQRFGERLGKASVTGYCIKFRHLTDIDLDTLEDIVRFGFEPR
ncbi:MAG: DUF1801 domain-containing protein [Pseudomonadota bacterium]